MLRKRKTKPSTPELRAFMRDNVPVWNKQCLRCAGVYNKLIRLCPECGYGGGALEGEVLDMGKDRYKDRPANYVPTLEEIEEGKKAIQAEWVANGDPRAEKGPVAWMPPRSIAKE